MNENFTLRCQEPKDRKELEHLVRESFWNIYRPGASEHYLLHLAFSHEDTLWEYSLVLEKEETLIGQILYTKANLSRGKESKDIAVCSFGPVSIIPSEQKKGYGDFLIRKSLELLRKSPYDYVVIFGNPDYYKKFGFRPAKYYGILLPHQKEEEELPFFMAIDLHGNGSIASIQDPYYFYESPLFDIHEEEVEAFDRTFP